MGVVKTKRVIVYALIIALLIASLGVCLTGPVIGAKAQNVKLTDDFAGWRTVPETDGTVCLKFDQPFLLKVNQKAGFTLNTEKDGDYNVYIKYRSLSDIVLKSTLTVTVNGISCMTQVTSLWQDDSEEYPTDGYKNELPCGQKTVDKYICDAVSDQASVSTLPFAYKIKGGACEISLVSNDVDLEISEISVALSEKIQSTDAYKKSLKGKKAAGETVIIEAEKCSFKSESSIRAGSVRNSALYPYDYRLKKCNVLDSASFNTAGQRVQYSFEIKESGIYNIGFRYSQNYKEDLPSYQNILIDSKPVCEAYQSVPFPYTGSDYGNLTVGDGEGAIGVYLNSGRHTVTLEADGTPISSVIERLSEILTSLSNMGVEIKKVSGGEANSYRTWDIKEYMPDLPEKLKGYRDELDEIYALLSSKETKNPAAAVNIKLASENISKLLKQKNKIPGNLQLLNEGSGSATQFLADQIDKLTHQNLSVDRIYVFSPSYKLPKASASGWTAFSCGVKRLLKSVTGNAGNGDEAKDGKTLDIWMNRSVQYVDTLQALADSQFTKQSGIKVKISVMSSEQRIILANASNSSPDVIMGVGSNTPFDLGIRGAVADLTEFSDFGEYISKEYNLQSLVPYVLGDAVYGVTETQEFYVLMMRTDIMHQLAISTPKTWNDVAEIMPALRRNSMNFYLQLSGYTGTKPIYSTVPFIIQSGGNIFKNNGLETDIQSNNSYIGFNTLTDLYRLYSVQKTVSSFYNSFRYGQIPIGIASFSDYVKIKNAAPEITGLWEIATAPGFEDENGNIRYGTTGASTACAIMNSCKNKDDAWDFLKWWLSGDVQIQFGNTMQMTYGADYLWNTANTEAFKKLAFPEKDKQVILKQWEQMTEIYRHPALYSVERGLSNAWNDVVINGAPSRIALDNAASEINHEFNRKLEEFGYIDSEGSVIKQLEYLPVEEIIKGRADK